MKYIKYLFILFLIIFLSTAIFSFLSYIEIVSDNIFKIINDFILFFSVFFINFQLGNKIDKDGYLEGLKFGSLIILIFASFRIIVTHNININKLIYYLLIIIISIFGSIFGINKKTKA